MTTWKSVDQALNNSKNWHITKILLFLFALLVGFLGINSLPLEPHDIYVIGTAEGMHQHNDWIVPYYYDQLRLNKPPMSYWITGLVAWCSNSFDLLQPWHGRLISVLSGLGMVALLLYLGERLYDRKTAAVGAILLITNMSFYKFTHSARPDLLYAFFCTAGYITFFKAFENFNKQQRYWYWSIGMWTLFAAATLTKGPHVPAMILIASIIYLFLQKYAYRQVLQLLKPVSGIILFVILTVPWWILVKQTVGSEEMASSQLSGSLLTINWQKFFRFYYLFNAWMIVAPWVLLVPFMLYRKVRFGRRKAETQFLLLLLLVAIVAFSFGPQARWFYLLPFIVPICLLLASTVFDIWGEHSESKGRIRFNFVIIVHWLIFALFLAWVLMTNFAIVPEVSSNKIGFLLILLLTTLVISIVFYRYRKNHPWLDLIAVLVLFLCIIATLGSTSLFWGKSRFEAYQLAQKVEKGLPVSIPLATFKTNPAAYLFYTHRPVKSFASVEQIESFLTARAGKTALIIRKKYMHKLRDRGFEIIGDCFAVDNKPHKNICVLLQNSKAGEKQELLSVISNFNP